MGLAEKKIEKDLVKNGFNLEDASPELVWLEAKQVLRGFPSLFKDLTPGIAQKIRSAGYKEFMRAWEELKEVKDGLESRDTESE